MLNGFLVYMTVTALQRHSGGWSQEKVSSVKVKEPQEPQFVTTGT